MINVCASRNTQADLFPGKLRIGELFFDVPVDYQKPYGTTLRVFARSVSRFNKPLEPTKEETNLPWLLFLQGGPGFGCSPPQNYSWIDPILTKGYQVSDQRSSLSRLYNVTPNFNHQVLFVDQRGTGLSSTITAATLACQGDAVKQAEYLKHFRADNIVRDCEAIRYLLTEDLPPDQRKWSIMGQSFGGFCALTYLSL